MGQKRCYFQKQSGEVAENKGKGYMDSLRQTGKQSGEVVENTWLWKKQTGNKPKTNLPILLKTLEGRKNEPEKRQPASGPSLAFSRSCETRRQGALRSQPRRWVR